VWPALRMMLINFHCYETKTFDLARLFAKKIALAIFWVKTTKAILINLVKRCKNVRPKNK
jgi:hypothetical protein